MSREKSPHAETWKAHALRERPGKWRGPGARSNQLGAGVALEATLMAKRLVGSVRITKQVRLNLRVTLFFFGAQNLRGLSPNVF